MIELVDTSPDVDVQPAEYIRLLGYPRGWELQDRAKELADWARAWYTAHGRPWIYAHEAGQLDLAGPSIRLGDAAFTSKRLVRTLESAGAHSAVLVAVSAGPEIEREAQALWQDGRPDEYFFLEVFGSAVVEHLVTMVGASLCAWADGQRMAVLPHYSPGYPEWPIDEQPRLLDLINRTRRHMLPVPIEVLESGMLRPKKSLLAVFGVTRHIERVRPLTDLIPCENCSFLPCQFRRSPYRRAPLAANPELSVFASQSQEIAAPAAPLDRSATYTVNARALQRWSQERLSVQRRSDGTVHAEFRYEGTTCTNMGRPLEFRYHVTLGPRDEGYPIREQRCAPADADQGHTYMCRYLTVGDELLTTIEREHPLQGQPLNDVLTWARPTCATGCYCEPDSRQHKWGLVLETIHYALARDHDAGTTP
jgi:hypothetical protein